MDKFGSTRFGFSNIFSVMLILLLVVMLVGIIAALVFSMLPLQGKTGFVVPRTDVVLVHGQEVVLLQHKGGDTFLLNASSSSPFSVIGFAVKTKAGTETARVAPNLKKYTFAPGDTICIYHSTNGYFITDTVTKVNAPAPFANGTYYLLITDETRKMLIMQLGPF